MVVLVRVIHGAISAFFISCLIVVYYCAITGASSPLLLPAIGALVLEGVIITANRGDCPLGAIHHRYGDDRAFFELLLPRRAAKLAVPVLGLITAVGIALLLM